MFRGPFINNGPIIGQGVRFIGKPMIILNDEGVDIKTGAMHDMKSISNLMVTHDVIVLNKNMLINTLQQHIQNARIVDYEICGGSTHPDVITIDVRTYSVVSPYLDHDGIIHVIPVYDMFEQVQKLEQVIVEKRRELQFLEQQLDALKRTANVNVHGTSHVMAGATVTDYSMLDKK